MSETLIHDKFRDKSRPRKPRNNEGDELRGWLAALGFESPPHVHINGIAFPTAVVVVDFGTPLAEPVKLTAEQSADLIAQIRAVTKLLYREREVSVRVQSDSNTGVWWSSVG